MDRQEEEGYSDQSGPDHHSYSQLHDSFTNHHHHHHRRNDASYDRQPIEEDDRCHRRQFSSSNGEESNSPAAWEDSNAGHAFPLSSRKRDFYHAAQGPSPDCAGGGTLVKLYVGAVPRTVTEEDDGVRLSRGGLPSSYIRSLFGEHGNVIEVVLLKDKRTAQQQECCFVKYATIEEADQAIRALHGRYTYPGGRFPLKVKYASGERDRLAGFAERVLTFKLYVGCVNKQASRRDIEEIFSPYGSVEDVFIVLDEMRQHKGCAFVQFSHREMAITAINALHGSYVMRGCEQPLIVRFADPKKPRVGDSRTTRDVSDQVAGHILPSYLNMPTHTADGIDCDWSEHICPDGYPYYYNCVTCESRWEKPEEYRL